MRIIKVKRKKFHTRSNSSKKNVSFLQLLFQYIFQSRKMFRSISLPHFIQATFIPSLFICILSTSHTTSKKERNNKRKRKNNIKREKLLSFDILVALHSLYIFRSLAFFTSFFHYLLFLGFFAVFET
jgi:hypothetical protein